MAAITTDHDEALTISPQSSRPSILPPLVSVSTPRQPPTNPPLPNPPLPHMVHNLPVLQGVTPVPFLHQPFDHVSSDVTIMRHQLLTMSTWFNYRFHHSIGVPLTWLNILVYM